MVCCLWRCVCGDEWTETIRCDDTAVYREGFCHLRNSGVGLTGHSLSCSGRTIMTSDCFIHPKDYSVDKQHYRTCRQQHQRSQRRWYEGLCWSLQIVLSFLYIYIFLVGQRNRGQNWKTIASGASIVVWSKPNSVSKYIEKQISWSILQNIFFKYNPVF